MRTTIRLDEELLGEARRVAAETGRTLMAVVEDALREAMAKRRAARYRKAVELPTFGGGGVFPGVDLDDTSALLDLMDETNGPPRR
ncbi:MAG: type II toxin-antitoxin system VapB family antitoxin [Chloroflexi bacterium]|nr:type II toxin-antitoxin system VapB family antitoxin [Chloroflexota bacterium]